MTFLTKTLSAVALACGLTMAATGVASAAAEDIVTTYHDALLAALARTQGEPDPVRYKALEALMDDAFDYEAMIRTAARSGWQSATDAEKKALVAAFRRVSIATNADRFADLKGGTFTLMTSRDGPRGLKLVETVLKPGDSDPVPLTYVLRQSKDGAPGQWRIIDVLLNGGISELAVRASEYNRVLNDGGVTALITALDKQAKTMLAY